VATSLVYHSTARGITLNAVEARLEDWKIKYIACRPLESKFTLPSTFQNIKPKMFAIARSNLQ